MCHAKHAVRLCDRRTPHVAQQHQQQLQLQCASAKKNHKIKPDFISILEKISFLKQFHGQCEQLNLPGSVREGVQHLRNMERPNVDDRGGDDVTTTLTASSSPSTRRRRRRIHGGERGEGGGGSGSGAEDKSEEEEEALIADKRRDRCKFFRN